MIMIVMCFCFTQDKADEVRIRDWSSDVGSSGLGLRPRNTPADEAGGVSIALQLGETVEILDARRAQQQAFGFDADVGGVHAGFRFTRVVICPLQERLQPDRKSKRLNSSH